MYRGDPRGYWVEENVRLGTGIMGRTHRDHETGLGRPRKSRRRDSGRVRGGAGTQWLEGGEGSDLLAGWRSRAGRGRCCLAA